MLKFHLKNFIRLVISILTVFLPPYGSKTFTIYCNLFGGKVYGGPNRFLKNITSSKAVKDSISITNWRLRGCNSALVFSSSWGKSFSRLCRMFGVKSVLRVDGFYVPDDIVDERFQQEKDFRMWVNRRLGEDLESFDHIIYQSQFSKKSVINICIIELTTSGSSPMEPISTILNRQSTSLPDLSKWLFLESIIQNI